MNKEGKTAPKEEVSGVAKPEVKQSQEKKDYIGCVMSLISKQEIRYVGTLIMINSQDQTLVLKNVKSYGSEGRRGGGRDEVPAAPDVYEHIIFRAAELKDFYVIKSPEKDFQDPAILSTEGKQKEKKEEKKVQPEPIKEEFKQDLKERPHTEYSGYEYRRRRRDYSRRYPAQRSSPRRVIGLYNEASNEELKEEYQEDYDFEAMNKKFETLFKENDKKIEIEEKYNKGKSFYDALSRGTGDKKDTPYDREQHMQTNAETFNLDYEAYKERRGGFNYRRGTGNRGYRRRSRGYSHRGQYSGRGEVRYARKNV